MPTDIHVKIFSYLTLKEQANSSRICKKFKATLIKSNALDYSNLFENFINQIITSLDKNRFLTLIGELKACIVSHPLNRSHSLLNLKENLESLIFPLAEILKKIPYEDLSFDFIHQNVCMPMEFTTKLFRVIGSLKSEILFI